jgi:uncharacterized repeat protein (TIGR03806 family)
MIVSVALLLSAGLPGLTIRWTGAPLEKLSAYGFFTGRLSDQSPAPGVIPYHLNTPLFTDYAEKLRFVHIPPGRPAVYNDSVVFDFPAGTTLIKTFYYPVDFRKPAGERRIIETRLLIREDKGWKAYPYIWNKEQTDAFLDVAGETRKVSYIDLNGRKQEHDYFIPNMNQCKGCHNKAEQLSPIGPSAGQLNGTHTYPEETANQLAYWKKAGLLEGLPDSDQIPAGIVWNDPETGTVEQRARAWLDINCAHCHQPLGPASTSGLFLRKNETDPLRLGINKTPVAAGRGSGDRMFSVVPGNPDASILVYRMESKDPGVMMPELGRSLIHKEGLALVRQWIREMK